MSYYDDDLQHYFDNNKKRGYKNLHHNLIKKNFKQLNEAFRELRNNNIIHRDIKPSNIFIKYTNEEKTDFDSILTGYGINTKSEGDESLMIGTPAFMAPEILKGNTYNNSVDLFSIGITIYYLYFGKFPNSSNNSMLALVKGPNLNFKIEEDRQLEDLIKKLLKATPDERITWEEYFNHPFFSQYEY